MDVGEDKDERGGRLVWRGCPKIAPIGRGLKLLGVCSFSSLLSPTA